jgi:hypothetical protein
MRHELMSPANPARTALSTNRPIFTFAVLTPRAMAARSLPPVAVIQLPTGARSSTNHMITASTTNQMSPA